MKTINLIILATIAILLIIPMAYSDEPATTVCCEKTTYGAWCQNNNPENCDPAYRKTPASCDATSYCKSGCCYDSWEGTCMENTPQLVCQKSNGTWADSAECAIPQCNQGCCLLDNQAAFVTLVRCKKLSSFFGLQTNFRTDIKSETACIAIAQAQDRGACVYDEDFTKTCKFTTRGECVAMKGKVASNTTLKNITFYKDFLCSAEELGTNCAPMRDKTTCIDGKDEVYFVDSCGNPANIYDASRENDKSYWRKIVPKENSCGFGNSNGNANSASCGNCDYFSGSFCRNYDKTKDKTSPKLGDSICRDLNCYNTQDGNNYRHGESWCIYDDGTGKGQDPAGSRQWKHVCIAGEELVEPCADFRQEVCIQDKITTDKGDFQQAGCRANRWQDCVAQKSQKDCENEDKRDCRWIENVIGSSILTAIQQPQQQTGQFNVNTPTFTNPPTNTPITGKAITGFATSDSSSGSSDSTDKKIETPTGSVCVPDVPPGLKFWSAGDSQGICAFGNAVCEIGYEKTGFIGGKEKCVKNCECEGDAWQKQNEDICKSLGDCSPGSEGVYKYLQASGFGVTGTKFFLPFVDYITGLKSASASQEKQSVNKGLLEGFAK